MIWSPPRWIHFKLIEENLGIEEEVEDGHSGHRRRSGVRGGLRFEPRARARQCECVCTSGKRGHRMGLSGVWEGKICELRGEGWSSLGSEKEAGGPRNSLHEGTLAIGSGVGFGEGCGLSSELGQGNANVCTSGRRGHRMGLSGVWEGKMCELRGEGWSSLGFEREAGGGKNSHDEGTLAIGD